MLGDSLWQKGSHCPTEGKMEILAISCNSRSRKKAFNWFSCAKPSWVEIARACSFRLRNCWINSCTAFPVAHWFQCSNRFPGITFMVSSRWSINPGSLHSAPLKPLQDLNLPPGLTEHHCRPQWKCLCNGLFISDTGYQFRLEFHVGSAHIPVWASKEILTHFNSNLGDSWSIRWNVRKFYSDLLSAMLVLFFYSGPNLKEQTYHNP